MSVLSRAARTEITDAGVSVREYVRRLFGDQPWGGDRCGCPDDRCIDHHHDADEPCGCLDVLLSELQIEAGLYLAPGASS